MTKQCLEPRHYLTESATQAPSSQIARFNAKQSLTDSVLPRSVAWTCTAHALPPDDSQCAGAREPLVCCMHQPVEVHCAQDATMLNRGNGERRCESDVK